jgi:hypothetical protein
VSAVILSLAIVAMASFGFLALFVILLIGMRTEGSQLRPSNAAHTGTERVVRRILGLYVRREIETTPAECDLRR